MGERENERENECEKYWQQTWMKDRSSFCFSCIFSINLKLFHDKKFLKIRWTKINEEKGKGMLGGGSPKGKGKRAGNGLIPLGNFEEGFVAQVGPRAGEGPAGMQLERHLVNLREWGAEWSTSLSLSHLHFHPLLPYGDHWAKTWTLETCLLGPLVWFLF